ncbi:MAG TPA: TPM domain-containing protein [Flavipsychrobacter sp.]|nr:TPM domain-containing protein [Flavipsychrobacter sp.]
MFSFSKKKNDDLLEQDDRERIVAAIRTVEAQTTGEIRVFVESSCSYLDALDRAKEIFAELKMSNTERRNAVLVYVALDDQQFAIFGDEQIYLKAGGPVFWEKAAGHLLEHFKESRIAEGIASCVLELGNALKHHFPYDPAVTKNELPDEIVFGK